MKSFCQWLSIKAITIHTSLSSVWTPFSSYHFSSVNNILFKLLPYWLEKQYLFVFPFLGVCMCCPIIFNYLHFLFWEFPIRNLCQFSKYWFSWPVVRTVYSLSSAFGKLVTSLPLSTQLIYLYWAKQVDARKPQVLWQSQRRGLVENLRQE